MNGVENEFTATSLQINTTYIISLKVENCAGYNITNRQVTTKPSGE